MDFKFRAKSRDEFWTEFATIFKLEATNTMPKFIQNFENFNN